MEKEKDKFGRAKCAAIMRWQNDRKARLSEVFESAPNDRGRDYEFECKAVEL
jgi:hypothetical protein